MNTSRIPIACMAAMLVAGSAALAAEPAQGKNASAPASGIAMEVRALTGAETRIVWIRHKQWEGRPTDHLDGGAGYSIMAFDTEEKKGERELVPEGEIHNPLISPDGRRVIYSAKTDGKLRIHCVDWNGANRRVLSDGFALWPWRDPATGIEWVYASNDRYGAFVERFQLDQPEVKERLYTGPVSPRFAVSADGTRAAGEFSHPNAGMLYTRTGQVDRKDYRGGCNTYISPDNSYFVTIMDGGHSQVTLYKPDASSRDVRLIPPGLKPLKRGGNGVVWNPKWASDARHISVAGPFRQLGPDHGDIWLGQFADDFNSITKWVQVTDNDYMDVFAYVWVDPELGRYAGEAPYTLAVPSAVAGQGEWAWDFGDGTKSRGPSGKHTYRTPGSYTITATQGDRVLRGRVTVKPRTKPRVISVQVFDDEHVQVQFDECINIDQAELSFKSGVTVGNAALDGVGLRLNLTLDGKLAEADTLRVQDIRDLAQEPNILTEDLKIVRPDWPAVRCGLVFLWEGHHKQSFNWNPQSRAFQDNTFHHRGQARFDRHGVMVLEGGTYTVTDGGSGIYSRCGETGKLTVESVITPFNLYQGSASRTSVAFGFGKPEEPNVALVQEENRLLLLIRMRHEDKTEVRRVELGTLEQDRPHHVIVTLADNALTCYVNGAVAKQAELKGTFAWNAPDWSHGLYMGGLPGNPYPWCGKLEGLAVYSGAFDSAQAARNYAVYAKTLAARPVAKQIQLRAELAARTRIPAAAEIAPYRDTLVVNEYDVVRVTQGQYAAPKLRVLQWGLLDTRNTWLAGAEVGQEFDLVIEKFADHPQLENEMTIDTMKEDFDLDLFVDVTHRPSGKPRPGRLTVHPRELWMPPNGKQAFSVDMLDQYGNPIQAPVTWSVKPGGQLDLSTAYGAGQRFEARDKAGSGAIGADGLFTSAATAGVVTILATAPGTPEAVGTAVVGIDNWPAIHAASGTPMRFGIDQHLRDGSKFTGDIDRIRIHHRTLSAAEIAASAAGKPGDDKGLVGDWTFDAPPTDGAFPNVVGEGLAAKLTRIDPKKGPAHIREGDRGFVRLDGQGYLEVAPDPRLDMTKHCTVEAWIRNASGMLACKQVVWMWGFMFSVNPRGLLTDALRVHGTYLLESAYHFSKDTWTHVAAVFDVNGHWLLYSNGKLVGEKKLNVLIIYE